MEEIRKSVSVCLAKYASFTGRADRPEFWWFMLAQFVVSMVVNMLIPTLGMLFALALLPPTIAAGARRLHDIGKTGWFQLLGFVPVAGWALLVYWWAQPGSPGPNDHGPAPAARPLVAPVRL